MSLDLKAEMEGASHKTEGQRKRSADLWTLKRFYGRGRRRATAELST